MATIKVLVQPLADLLGGIGVVAITTPEPATDRLPRA
jgi:hypothetical protein